MDYHKADECLNKLQNNDHEQEIAENNEILLTNELLLLREEDLKMELDTETVSDDPLDLIDEHEIKIETPEISFEFLNAESATTHVVTLDTDYPSSSSSSRKSRRCPVGEFDNALLDITLEARGKGPARRVANIMDAWHLLFDEKILANVLKHTNDEIKKPKGKDKVLDNNNQRMLDLPELSAWIGLNYLAGIFSKSSATLEELWTPELGNGIFRASMSLKRFQFISECLRLGEKSKTRRKHHFEVILQSVTEVWEQFIANCRSCYEPSTNCTVQDQVLDMSATDYPKKFGINLAADAAHCGIRVIGLHDSKTHYLFNALIRKLTPADGTEVLALVRDIKNSNRNVILPECYTSLKLAQQLLECSLAVVGSLSAKSKDVPVEFSTGKSIHKNKDGNIFSFLSENSESEVLLTSGIGDKINVNKLYAASSKSGELFYQSAACFSTTTISNTSDMTTTTSQSSWTLRFFHTILDYACINAGTLFRLSQQGDAAVQQRDFQRQLGIYLTQKYLKGLLHKNAKTSLQRKLFICDVLGESPEKLLSEAVSAAVSAAAQAAGTTDNSSWKLTKLPNHVQLVCKKIEKRRRCRVCTWRNNNLTCWQCQQCARPMCPTHLTNRCEQCLGIETKSKGEYEEQDEYFK